MCRQPDVSKWEHFRAKNLEGSLFSLLRFFGLFDVAERDGGAVAHAAEDAVGPVEELLWGVELLKETSAMYSGALENDRSTDRYISRVENEDAIVRNDRAQTVCATVETR